MLIYSDVSSIRAVIVLVLKTWSTYVDMKRLNCTSPATHGLQDLCYARVKAKKPNHIYETIELRPLEQNKEPAVHELLDAVSLRRFMIPHIRRPRV